MSASLRIYDRPATAAPAIRLSEVLSALSYALDLTEGQPQGHAVKSTLIGMRLAQQLGLPAEQHPPLFYALLLKDLGCSSNATRMQSLFGGDERVAKREAKLVDWPRLPNAVWHGLRTAAAHGTLPERTRRVLLLALAGPAVGTELIQTRCERGAYLARMLGLPEETAAAIRALDEHWNGHGAPDGLRGAAIPLFARIAGLAQTMELFHSARGLDAAFRMARTRSGRWFDPELVRALEAFRADTAFWAQLDVPDARLCLAPYEPSERFLPVDEARLDVVAEAFALVVDAKSPWTYRHSERVADIATGVGRVLGMNRAERRETRRAALLHDIGKLGISNRILDKRGPLTADERVEIALHAEYTRHILERVACFRRVAELAGAHHERLDGGGYPAGLAAEDLPMAARVVKVADICEALLADRPYRAGLSRAEMLAIMRAEVGSGICPHAFGALCTFLEQTNYDPARVSIPEPLPEPAPAVPILAVPRWQA